MLELDELIAIMEYKAKNIKAHISPATINQIVEILRHHKVVTEDFAKNHRGVKGEMGNN